MVIYRAVTEVQSSLPQGEESYPETGGAGVSVLSG